MIIRVIAFASASDALETGELEVELAPGSTLADLERRLKRDFPRLEPIWGRLALAVDGELVRAEASLREGSEVALLPPVSGGAPEPRAGLTEGPIDEQEILHRVAEPERGARVLFLGVVRNSHRGRAVARLTYHAYRPMALAALERIVDELERTAESLQLAIVHRLGEVAVGEVSVAIATASPHRDAAFDACRTALERLKREVPIWKLEHYADGQAAWREDEPLVGA